MGAATSAASACSPCSGWLVLSPPLALVGPDRLHAPSPQVLASLGEVSLVLASGGFLPVPALPAPSSQVAALFALPFQKAFLWLSRLPSPASSSWSDAFCCPLSAFLPSVWLSPQGTWSRRHREAHRRRWVWDPSPGILAPSWRK